MLLTNNTRLKYSKALTRRNVISATPRSRSGSFCLHYLQNGSLKEGHWPRLSAANSQAFETIPIAKISPVRLREGPRLCRLITAIEILGIVYHGCQVRSRQCPLGREGPAKGVLPSYRSDQRFAECCSC